MPFRAETTSSVLATLDAKIQEIAKESEAAKQAELGHEKALQATLKEVFEKQKEKTLGGGSAPTRRVVERDRDGVPMDVDEDPGNGKNKNRKSVMSSLLFDLF